MMMITPEQLTRLRADRAAYKALVESQQEQAVAARQHRLARARATGQAMAVDRLSWAQVEALRALLRRLQNPFPGEWNGQVVRRLLPILSPHVSEDLALCDDADAMSFLQGITDVAAAV